MFGRFDTRAAEKIVESFRFGIPPKDVITDFTVGRDGQIEELRRLLYGGPYRQGRALLLKANYGSGKSHMLQLLRKTSLDSEYAVSMIVVDSQGGVRFNRMDSILGEIANKLESSKDRKPGIGSLFDAFYDAANMECNAGTAKVHLIIKNGAPWGPGVPLKSPAVHAALRVWPAIAEDGKELIEDWFANPSDYRGQRKLIYKTLVEPFLDTFQEPRTEMEFYSNDVFTFHTDGFQQSWDAISDLDSISRAVGLGGLVLLFDEFEDIVQNLNRRELQKQAYSNLFRFFTGESFPGTAVFAVTPDFLERCTSELQSVDVYDMEVKGFAQLPTLSIDQISEEQFLSLAKRIRDVHGLAYGWDSNEAIGDRELEVMLSEFLKVSEPNRIRSAVQDLVSELDDRLEMR